MSIPRKPIATLALLAACAGAGFGGFSYFQNAEFARAEQRVEATREQLSSIDDLANVFKSVNKVMEPSVVSIDVKKTVRNVSSNGMPKELRRFFNRDPDAQPDSPDADTDGDTMIQRGTGSGVIMEVDGGKTAYIVTNNHVAGDAQEMEIILSDGRVIHNGKLVGTDPKSDIAVVKITIDRVIPAKWGDSDKLAKGDWIMAFGSPLGYVGSMTHGIVSALNRQSDPTGRSNILGQFGYENFIQVDAPINPGNSGGPLVNVHGEVVGINTAIASRTGGFQGIGFAVPSDQARPIYDSLRKNGKVTRGYLGVEIVDVARDTQAARSTGYTGDSGVFVRGAVRGTPAFGKLEPGDVVTKVGGKEVRTTQELRNQIAVTPPGTDVVLTVFRDGKNVDVTIKLGEQPEDLAATGMQRKPTDSNESEQSTVDNVGVKLIDPNDALRTRYGLSDAGDGAIVTAIAPESPAAQAGLRMGDLITRVNDKDVTDAETGQAALTKADLSKGLSLRIANATGSRLVFIPAEAFKKVK